MRTLVNTRTNHTPHELFFKFDRLSGNSYAHPSWLVPGNDVLLRRHVRNKNDPLTDTVHLLQLHQRYASVRFPGGRTDTVSLRDLAPCPASPGSVHLEPEPSEIYTAPPDISMEEPIIVQDSSQQSPIRTFTLKAKEDMIPAVKEDGLDQMSDPGEASLGAPHSLNPSPRLPRRSCRKRKQKKPYDC